MKGEIEVADTVKKILNFAKRKWIYIWLIVAAVAACGVTVWAIYSTGSNEMRKIARGTGETPKQAFSSNYLTTSGGTKNYETAEHEQNAEGTTEPYTVTVELYNYDTETPGTLYNGVITYTLKATLVNSSEKELDAAEIGENTVKIYAADADGNKSGSEIVTLSKSTIGEQIVLASDSFGNAVAEYTEVTAATKKYIIEYSSGCYGSIYVKLVADTTTSGLEDLSGIIGVTEQKAAISQGWTVSLAEDTTKEPSNYDGYNLVVKGSGEATIEITLNTAYLEANKFFTELYDFDNDEVNVDGGTITINANSTEHNRNRYEIQLYKTGSGECSGWDTMISDTNKDAWVYYSVENKSDTTTTTTTTTTETND